MSASAVAESGKQRPQPLCPHGLVEAAEQRWHPADKPLAVLAHILGATPCPCQLSSAAVGLLGHRVALALAAGAPVHRPSFPACATLLDNWEGNQKMPLVSWVLLVLSVQLLGLPY